MQKALTQMNLQLGNVITDIVGRTGQQIIRAIVAGERDPVKLAGLRDSRIHASEAEIAKSLRGTWREEHLFALSQALKQFDAYQERIAECDARLAQALAKLARHGEVPEPKKRKGRSKNAPGFDVRTALFQACGVDLTRIDAIDVSTALKVAAEVGPDLSKFKTVKHFCSWFGLCPGTKISGGNRLSGATKRCTNRLAQALKLAATGLLRSKSALGAYFRRMAGRMDKSKAIKAAAHNLARLIYSALTKGTEYVDRGQDHYEQQYRQRVLTNLHRKAAAIGFQLNPMMATV